MNVLIHWMNSWICNVVWKAGTSRAECGGRNDMLRNHVVDILISTWYIDISSCLQLRTDTFSLEAKRMYLFWAGDKMKSFGSSQVMLCVSDHQSMLWIFEWTCAPHIFLVFLAQRKSAKCSSPLDVWSCHGPALLEQVCLILALGPSSLISQSRALTSKPSLPQTLANGTTCYLCFSLLKMQASKESNSLSPTLITHIILVKEVNLKLKKQLLENLEVLWINCLPWICVRWGNL